MAAPDRASPAIAALPDRLAPLVARARASSGMLIVATLFTLVPGRGGEPIISPHLKSLRPFLKKGDFAPGAWGQQLVDELAPADVAVEKIAYSAFHMSRLEWVLRKCGIEHLYFTGIVTNGGVASTVRDAHVREFDCTVIEDGCAAFSDDVHRAAIEGLRPVAKNSDNRRHAATAGGEMIREVWMTLRIPRLATFALLIATLLPGSSLTTRADDYPSKPIKLLVGASPGGTTDTMARAIAQPLSVSLGKPVLVENRPGAGGNLAADAVAKSAPDGHTLLVSFTSHTINATLYPKLPFDPVADFTPISMISTVPSLLVGNPKLVGPGPERADCECESQAGHLDDRYRRDRLVAASCRRPVQDDGRRPHPQRALQGNGAGAHRCARRSGRHDVHQSGHRDGSGPRRQAASLWRDDRAAATVVSRPARNRRGREGLRVRPRGSACSARRNCPRTSPASSMPPLSPRSRIQGCARNSRTRVRLPRR